jgi:hypothetical protein
VTAFTESIVANRYLHCMEPKDEIITPMEQMARRLALMAGVDWTRLLEYPGYERNHWRHQAETLIAKMEWARLQ